MINIAICDDELPACNQLEQALGEIAHSHGEAIDITVFTDGKDLCKFMADGMYFDVIFLDIEMREMNGIQAGQFVRETLGNETSKIIYVSAKESYAMALFDQRPMGFLIKPVDTEKVSRLFRKAVQLIHQGQDVFRLQVDGEHLAIPLKEILYFKRDGRRVQLMTSAESHYFYGTIAELAKTLEAKDFLWIDRACLINYDHVRRFGYTDLTLNNGESFDISRPKRKIINEQQNLIQRKRGFI